jgi:hypothetical protein
MGAQGSTGSANAVIRRLAPGQFGLVARAQLLAAGVTRSQIATRLEAGHLSQLHRGVYLVGSVAGESALEMAAFLSCGPGALS